MNIELTIILINVILITCLICDTLNGLNINENKKKESTKKILNQPLPVSNFEQDFKLLHTLIDEFVDNIAFTELREYYESNKIINDATFSELSKKLTLQVFSSLSEDYLYLIKRYVSEPEVFIFQKIHFKLLNIVMTTNTNNIRRMNNRAAI